MANYFTLTLDTTGPSNPQISFPGAYTNIQLVTVTISTGDPDTTGYQMLIWGDVDASYDANVQTLEQSVADPSTAPILQAVVDAGSSLPAGTYYVKYTWATQYGESLPSPEASQAIAAGEKLVITLPSFPSGVTKAKIYISNTSGAETLQGETTTTTYEQISSLQAGVNPPVSNTLTGSAWIAYATSYQVKLSAGDGPKNIYLKIRDDVLNVSAQASDSIILDTVAPVVVITLAPSVSKISKIAPKDSVSFKWQADSDFAEYIVAVVPTSDSGHTAGTVIPTTGGSQNTSGLNGTANTEITTVIKGADLEAASPGDGQKIIKVFVKDLANNWSN